MKHKLIFRLAGLGLLMLMAASAKAGPIGFSFHDTTVVGGNLVEYPIYIDSSVTGLNVISYQIEFTFNTSLFTFVDAQSAGTLSAGWTTDVNQISVGKISVAGIGPALSGKGRLVIFRFMSNVFVNYNYGYFYFQKIMLNEGVPTTVKRDGYITIQPPPFITVNPNTALLTKGETQQFTVSGGKVPYVWSTTNPSVASINSSGLLTALQAGKTQVVCADSAGIVDTSGFVEVRGLKLWFRDTTRYQGQTLDLPVYTTDVTGLGIISGQFSVSYNQTLWTPSDIITTGTLLQTANTPTFSLTANQINVSFATSTPLTGSGILLYIRMKATKATYGGSGFNFISLLFNQTILSNTSNGYITVQQLSPVTITPYGNQTMLVGDSIQFNATGGTAPYTWSVADPLRATISPSGWLKATKSGIDTAIAQDILGSIGRSGKIDIYDFRLSVPDTSLIPASTVDIPFFVTPNTVGFPSVQMKITYSTGSYVQLMDIISAGTLTSGWSFGTSFGNGTATIAASGVTPVYSGGVLFKLRFAVPDSTPRPSTIYINLSSVLFKEGVPVPLIDNGYFTIANNAVFSVTPASGVIQSAAVSQKDSMTFTVHNSGTATLTSSMGITGSSEFTLSTYNISVPPGDSVKIKAYYLPTNAGGDTATINFNTNDPYHSSVHVQLIGKITQFPIIGVNPSFIDFGTVKVGQWKDTAVTISNTGSDTLKVTSVACSIGSFTARSTSFQVAPGNSFVDTLRFAPASIATFTSYFLVTNNGSSSPDTIKVTGVGQTALSVGTNNAVPNEFVLHQNYPNPFNPATTILFKVPNHGRALLKVYNMLGQEVAELFNDIVEPGKYYDARFDAKNLSSGIYLARLSFDNEQLMMKMTLMK